MDAVNAAVAAYNAAIAAAGVAAQAASQSAQNDAMAGMMTCGGGSILTGPGAPSVFLICALGVITIQTNAIATLQHNYYTALADAQATLDSERNAAEQTWAADFAAAQAKRDLCLSNFNCDECN